MQTKYLLTLFLIAIIALIQLNLVASSGNEQCTTYPCGCCCTFDTHACCDPNGSTAASTLNAEDVTQAYDGELDEEEVLERIEEIADETNTLVLRKQPAGKKQSTDVVQQGSVCLVSCPAVYREHKAFFQNLGVSSSSSSLTTPTGITVFRWFVGKGCFRVRDLQKLNGAQRNYALSQIVQRCNQNAGPNGGFVYHGGVSHN